MTTIHITNRDTGSSGVIPADAGVPVTPEVQFQSDDRGKKVLLVALNARQASSSVM